MVNKFRLGYLSSLILLNLGVVNSVVAADTKQQNINEDEEARIVITGIRGSLIRSMDMKRDADNIVDAISSEDIGKFPDQNVAESLQRITGVAIDRNGGEGQLVSVRGLGPEFNSVLVNGRTMATISGGRAFSFDTLASELISGAEVHKTQKANLTEGAIGATINVTTLRPLDINGFKAVGSAKAFYDHMTGSTKPQFSGLLSNTFADNKMGALVSIAYSERESQYDHAEVAGYRQGKTLNLANGSTLENVKPPRNYDQIAHEESRKRTGGTVSFQYQPVEEVTMTVDALYSKYEVDYTQNVLAHWIEPGAITDATIDANRTVTSFTSAGADSKTDFLNRISNRPTETQAYGFNVSWDATDSLSLFGDIAYSEAESENGGKVTDTVASYQHEYTLDNTAGELLPALTFPTSINMDSVYAGWAARGGDDINDEILEVKLDGEFKFDSGVLAKIGFGTMYSDRTLGKTSYSTESDIAVLYGNNKPNHVNLPQSLFSTYDADGFLSAAHGNPAQQWLAFNSEELFSYLLSDTAINQLADPAAARALLAQHNGYSAHRDNSAYEINEQTQSFYVDFQLEGELGLMPWSVTAGVRYVETENLSSGQQQYVTNITSAPNNEVRVVTSDTYSPVEVTYDYSDVLPSINANIEFTDELVMRFAYSESITRSDLSKMSPVTSYGGGKVDDLKGSGGNPQLKPYESTNFDLILEWYYDEGSYAAVGGFTKDIDNFIDDGLYNEVLTVPSGQYNYTMTRPKNTDDAQIDGYELAVQHVFNSLPEPFNGLGFIANMTFVDSESSTINSGKPLPLVGLGDSQNLIVFYEQESYQFRVAYNNRDKFVQSTENYYSGEPVWVDDYYQLDISGSYDINDNFTVFFEGLNVTNETTIKRGTFDNHILDVIETGPRYALGFRASF